MNKPKIIKFIDPEIKYQKNKIKNKTPNLKDINTGNIV